MGGIKMPGIKTSGQYEPVIISASRRTDIPAYYSEWFINRIRAGYFVKVNPYNPKQQKQVSLLPEKVAALVFWTKNPKPLMAFLPILDSQKYHYLFHFTLNHYSKVWEPRLPALKERIATFKRLGEEIGPEKLIWRYDPIIVSNLNPIESHLEQFQQIAGEISGYTQRVMISLVTLYDKVLLNMKRLGLERSLQLKDLRAQEHHQELQILLKGLASIANQNRFMMFSCSEQLDLTPYNILPGSCIDSQLLNQLFNLHLKATKDKYQRAECHCVPSIDMGSYDTCRFGCAYCYANQNMERVFKNASLHDPASPKLLGI